MFRFHGRKGFGECVGDHVIGRTVNEADRAVFDDVSNEMKTNVNMFGSGMVLVIFRELDS